MTCSGGDCGVAADLAARARRRAARARAGDTVARLEACCPRRRPPHNPLDYTSLLWDEPDALRALVARARRRSRRRPGARALRRAAGLDGAAAESWAAVLDGCARAAASTASASLVASTLPELLDDATAAALQRDGVAAVAGLRSGLRCAAALRGAAPRPARASRAIGATRAGAPRGATLARRARGQGAAARRPGCPSRRARSPATRTTPSPRWRELGGPVAIKLVRPGAAAQVRARRACSLGLDDERESAAARAGCRAARRRRATCSSSGWRRPAPSCWSPSAPTGVVPVLVVGLGGVWTEVLDDVARHRRCPVDAERVEPRCASLRARRRADRRARPPRRSTSPPRRVWPRARRELAARARARPARAQPRHRHERGAVAVDALARPRQEIPHERDRRQARRGRPARARSASSPPGTGTRSSSAAATTA